MMRLIMVMMMILAAVGFTSLAIAPDFFLLLIISLAKEHNFSFITDLGEQAFRKRCNEVNLQVLGFTKCK